ncbi:MAG: hypothetical protein ACREMA_20075 [Longimicrobiales bacterium]
MRTKNLWRLATVGVVALAAGVGWFSVNPAAQPAGTPMTPPAREAAAEIAELRAEIMQLKAEIEQLKGRTPDQSHVMKDVGYHFANLWFAGQQQNWPLATFYLTETRSHLQWAVRIIPVRKTQAGELDLHPILDGMDRTLLTDLQKAIDERERDRFTSAYTRVREGCYACHQAAEKPYLRPHIPAQPEVQIMHFDPDATRRE